LNYYYHFEKGWWQRICDVVLIGLVIAASGYVGYVEGYRRGCQDALTVVEDRAEKLGKAIERRILGG
jgi:hypothetical protein